MQRNATSENDGIIMKVDTYRTYAKAHRKILSSIETEGQSIDLPTIYNWENENFKQNRRNTRIYHKEYERVYNRKTGKVVDTETGNRVETKTLIVTPRILKRTPT